MHNYGVTGAVLALKFGATTAEYMLRRWSVDCCSDHRLRDPEYRLWPNDHLALYGVKNAMIAPGYATSPKADS